MLSSSQTLKKIDGHARKRGFLIKSLREHSLRALIGGRCTILKDSLNGWENWVAFVLS